MNLKQFGNDDDDDAPKQRKANAWSHECEAHNARSGDNVILYGSCLLDTKLYGQIMDISMGTIVADLYLFCY